MRQRQTPQPSVHRVHLCAGCLAGKHRGHGHQFSCSHNRTWAAQFLFIVALAANNLFLRTLEQAASVLCKSSEDPWLSTSMKTCRSHLPKTASCQAFFNLNALLSSSSPMKCSTRPGDRLVWPNQLAWLGVDRHAHNLEDVLELLELQCEQIVVLGLTELKVGGVK